MKKLAGCIVLFGLLISAGVPSALGGSSGAFNTKYTKIHYSDRKDLDDFIWRLGGERRDFPEDPALVSNRVDRIIERVEAILDMRPRNFCVDVYLRRGLLDEARAAFFDRKTYAIHISVDYSSDGVFAHEAAHAVISRYFSVKPPDKVQEILTQYVDRYLWNDY